MSLALIYPSRLSQSTRLGSLCYRIYLAHGGVCVPMLLSQFIPPSPSSAVSVLYICVSIPSL